MKHRCLLIVLAIFLVRSFPAFSQELNSVDYPAELRAATMADMAKGWQESQLRSLETKATLGGCAAFYLGGRIVEQSPLGGVIAVRWSIVLIEAVDPVTHRVETTWGAGDEYGYWWTYICFPFKVTEVTVRATAWRYQTYAFGIDNPTDRWLGDIQVEPDSEIGVTVMNVGRRVNWKVTTPSGAPLNPAKYRVSVTLQIPGQTKPWVQKPVENMPANGTYLVPKDAMGKQISGQIVVHEAGNSRVVFSEGRGFYTYPGTIYKPWTY